MALSPNFRHAVSRYEYEQDTAVTGQQDTERGNWVRRKSGLNLFIKKMPQYSPDISGWNHEKGDTPSILMEMTITFTL